MAKPGNVQIVVDNTNAPLSYRLATIAWRRLRPCQIANPLTQIKGVG